MKKYKKILAAVDGSDASRNAFRQTCRIARAGNGMITAIMSVPIYQDQFDVFTTREKITDSLRAEGERILSGIKKIAEEENVPVNVMVDEGSPFKTIPAVADEGGYDLIVMGRRGMTGLKRVMMGSVTERVIGYTRKAVLVVPREASVGWKNILLATDGSVYGEAAAARALDFAESYGGNLTVVTVVDMNEEYYALAPAAAGQMVENAKAVVETIRKQAEARSIHAKTHVLEGEPYKEIVELADKEKSEIIFMSSHGRTGLMRMFMGSVAAKVIGHSACPVMVIKDQAHMI